MSERADRLLCCAMNFRDTAEKVSSPLPSRFADLDAGIHAMMRVLKHEARESLREPIAPPEQPYLHPVDVDTDEPGIVSSQSRLDIMRRKAPFPTVRYRRRNAAAVPANLTPRKNDVDISTALKEAEKQTSKAIVKSQKTASRDIQHDIEIVEKRKKQEEKRQQRATESAEEREERLQMMRAKRRENKAKRELEGEAPKRKAKRETVEETTNEEISPTSPTIFACDAEAMLDQEADDENSAPQVLPPKQRMRNRKVRFFASVVPFDRHLAALESCNPLPHISNAFVSGTPNENAVDSRPAWDW